MCEKYDQEGHECDKCTINNLQRELISRPVINHCRRHDCVHASCRSEQAGDVKHAKEHILQLCDADTALAVANGQPLAVVYFVDTGIYHCFICKKKATESSKACEHILACQLRRIARREGGEGPEGARAPEERQKKWMND